MHRHTFSLGTEAFYRIKVALLVLANIGWLVAVVYLIGRF